MRGGVARRAAGLALGLALTLPLGPAGCHRKLVKLSGAGQHAEVVRRASTARRLPKDAAARAWAGSLVALGRVDEARAVLQFDYRHGGHVASLVALADLELGQGLEGMAAAHYARIFSLETGPLHDRRDVCSLFAKRARAFLAQGEPVAAHVDMRRVRVLCGEPDRQSERLREATLWGEIEAAAEHQVRAQRVLARPGGSVDGVPMGAETNREPATRPAIRSTVDAALGEGRQLVPDQLAAALEGELGGRLGPTMLADDELRVLVGDASWDVLVPAIDRLDARGRAYAKLRMTAIRVNGLDAEQGERQRQRWAMQVMGDDVAPAGGGSETPDPERSGLGGWRSLVVVGDLAGAELALATSLRARLPALPAPEDGDASPGRRGGTKRPAQPPPSAAVVPTHQDRVEPPEQWFGRVPVTPETSPELLALARLFTARGEDGRAVALARWVVAEAHAHGVAGLEADARAMAHAWLEQGRPWSALAFAEVLGGGVQADTRAVAATMIELERIACGKRCGEDRARREVEALMGEAWVAGELAELLELPVAATPAGWCPALGELLAPDAQGPLARALAATRDGTESARLAGVFAHAIEADVTLTCAAEHLTPLMAERGFTVTADKLSERLAHTPELESAGQFETHARLALLAGDEMRARTMIDAAAAISADPREVWRRAARDGATYGAPVYAARAWRQLLMLDPRAADEEARRELVLGQLRSLATTFHGRETPTVQQSIDRALEQWLGRDPARRWSRVEDLARCLAAEPWPDPEVARSISSALWDDDERARHPVGAAYLGRALGESSTASPLTPLGFDAAALDLAAKDGSALPTGAAVARPGAASRARLEAAIAAAPGPNRTRDLVALAATGAPEDRVRALLELSRDLADADPDAGRSLRASLAQGWPAAGPGLLPVPLLDDPPAQRQVLLGLDLERVRPAR